MDWAGSRARTTNFWSRRTAFTPSSPPYRRAPSILRKATRRAPNREAACKRTPRHMACNKARTCYLTSKGEAPSTTQAPSTPSRVSSIQRNHIPKCTHGTTQSTFRKRTYSITRNLTLRFTNNITRSSSNSSNSNSSNISCSSSSTTRTCIRSSHSNSCRRRYNSRVNSKHLSKCKRSSPNLGKKRTVARQEESRQQEAITQTRGTQYLRTRTLERAALCVSREID